MKMTCSLLFLTLSACNFRQPIPSLQDPTRIDSLPVTSTSNIGLVAPDSVSIDFQFRGNCYAYSSSKNAEPSNGECHSTNFPQRINDTFPRSGFYLLINPQQQVILDGDLLGCKLFLVNTSEEIVTLSAQDSRLDIVAEALDKQGNWKPISYLPSSTCGNSYHTVKLDEEEAWSFDVPIFKGEFKTKLRYSLTYAEGQQIHSNEVDAFLNLGQFDEEKKQGHKPMNLMDPYTD